MLVTLRVCPSVFYQQRNFLKEKNTTDTNSEQKKILLWIKLRGICHYLKGKTMKNKMKKKKEIAGTIPVCVWVSIQIEDFDLSIFLSSI